MHMDAKTVDAILIMMQEFATQDGAYIPHHNADYYLVELVRLMQPAFTMEERGKIDAILVAYHAVTKWYA
jgi:hypothetical protein